MGWDLDVLLALASIAWPEIGDGEGVRVLSVRSGVRYVESAYPLTRPGNPSWGGGGELEFSLFSREVVRLARWYFPFNPDGDGRMFITWGYGPISRLLAVAGARYAMPWGGLYIGEE